MPEAEHYQHYELLRRGDGTLWELGRGTMGTTFKAYDTNLHCTVALKVINSACLESDTARQRFLREARAAAALRHQNVASVFHLGTDHGNYFYAMEFIDGETVEAYVKRKGRLEPVEALNIVLQVARALAAASKQRLVHRDLKPANLMLVDEEGEPTVKVIDFGLAKSAKDGGEDSGTLTMGGFVGTPHFASPEQVKEGEIDIRSDIYSLGATLYFIVTGKLPFSGSVGHVMSQHLYKPISMEPLTDVPRCVVSLIQRMMEKDRNLRPQTPRDLQDAIFDCLEQIYVPTPQGGGSAGEAPSQSLSVAALFAHNYRLIEELRDTRNGRTFLAEDLRRKRRVSLLVLSPEFISAPNRFTALEVAVDRVRNAPHPMLRATHALETAAGYSVLVEEPVLGPALLDVLRVRHVLSAPEVARLLKVLAPLADHASSHGLQHVNLTLPGIHLVDREWAEDGLRTDLLRRPLTAWEPLEPMVDAIEFGFSSCRIDTWAGAATWVESPVDNESRGSCVRLLSLLAYELLGGPRARVEAAGQYSPLATLSEEGNAVLRRGLVDESPSAEELARQLAAAVGMTGLTAPLFERTERATPDPVAKAPQQEEGPTDTPKRRSSPVSVRRVVLSLGFVALLGSGGYVIHRSFHRAPPVPSSPSAPVELAALSVQSEPAGATVLLDGKPAAQPPGTFPHVPFGKHQLTATLDGYEPFTQDLQVRQSTNPDLRVTLQRRPPPVELAALSVQSEPAGATVLLDDKPAPLLPGTFLHVPFGKHQLTATLDGYEPFTQELQVHEGMSPELPVTLQRRPPPVESSVKGRLEDAPIAAVHKTAKYRGILKTPGGGPSIPCTVELDASGLAGTITYGSRLGDTVVRFSGHAETDTLRADTGEVVSKPVGVKWSKETFTLTFRPDGSGAIYHCVEPSSSLTGTLTSP